MSKDYGLTGVGSPLELSKGGAKLKNSSGVLESRNNADDAYAILRVADGAASNDAVNKGQLDAVSQGNAFTTVAGDSGSALADSNSDTLTISGGDGIDTTASDDPEVLSVAVDVTDIIDATAGLTETANDIQVSLESDGGLAFDGSNYGIEIKPDSTTGTTVAPLTVGSNGAGVTVDEDTIEHSSGVLSAKDSMQYKKVDFDYTDQGSTVNISDAVPAGATVIGWMAQVDTLFDGTTPVLDIGDAGDPDAIGDQTEIDLGTAGLYVGDCWVEYVSSTQLIGTIGGSSATQGAGSILIKYVL